MSGIKQGWGLTPRQTGELRDSLARKVFMRLLVPAYTDHSFLSCVIATSNEREMDLSELLAALAYEHAESMLVEREKYGYPREDE